MMQQRLALSAAIVLAAAVLPGCAGADSTETTSATTLAVTATTAAATTTTAAAATTAAVVTTTTTPGLLTAPAFVVPFEMTATGVFLVKSTAINTGWIDYRAGSGQYVVFTVGGPESVDAWVEYLTTDDLMIATEPQITDIGGQTATTIDVRLSGDPFDLFTYAPAPGDLAVWGIEPGAADRIHLVEVDGVTIAIIIEAPEAAFEEFAAAVDASLATLEWNPAG